jgi:hypothetical protein
LIADPTGAALFLYQLEAEASVDPIIAAGSTRGSVAGRDDEDRDARNVHFSVTVGYGFYPSWDSAYPDYPERAFGPRF